MKASQPAEYQFKEPCVGAAVGTHTSFSTAVSEIIAKYLQGLNFIDMDPDESSCFHSAVGVKRYYEERDGKVALSKMRLCYASKP